MPSSAGVVTNPSGTQGTRAWIEKGLVRAVILVFEESGFSGVHIGGGDEETTGTPAKLSDHGFVGGFTGAEGWDAEEVAVGPFKLDVARKDDVPVDACVNPWEGLE